MLHEAPRGARCSSRTQWLCFLGLPARWWMSILLWVFDSRLCALGGLRVLSETGGEPCLLVRGGGGGQDVVMGGDEV